MPGLNYKSPQVIKERDFDPRTHKIYQGYQVAAQNLSKTYFFLAS